MVCPRCIMVVQSELEKLGFKPLSVELGKVDLSNEIDQKSKTLINNTLSKFGFELLEDKNSIIIEKIKTGIIELIHHNEDFIHLNLSDYLSNKLNYEYSGISKLFSESEGITIEQYFISQKIEKVKELITYNELTLSEIANRLNYSSSAHLSNQFKKVTGYTPGQFKKNHSNKRKSIEDL